MPLKDSYPYGVVFIGRALGPTLSDAPHGTGFLVGLDSSLGLGGHAYIVTAKHVVDRVRQSFVLIDTLPLGSTKEIPIKKWVYNDQGEDVAVAPISLPANHNMTATGIQEFMDDPSLDEDEWFQRGVKIELGDHVYFIGLLEGIDAMREGNVPMVRSGTLGAIRQEGVPVRRKRPRQDDELDHITAQLIDCRSFGGFSGSPCYLHQARAGISDRGVTTKYRTLLLGVVGGHFDDWAEVHHTGGKSEHLRVEANSGVAYVIPVEAIRHTLMQKELVDMREEDERKRSATERGATEDNADNPEFEAFERLIKGLVQVPKSELDAERKKDEGSN
jgi:hypothetical protein